MRALPPMLQAYAFRPAPQDSASLCQIDRALAAERVRDRALPAALQVEFAPQAVAVLRVELGVQLAALAV